MTHFKYLFAELCLTFVKIHLSKNVMYIKNNAKITVKVILAVCYFSVVETPAGRPSSCLHCCFTCSAICEGVLVIMSVYCGLYMNVGRTDEEL